MADDERLKVLLIEHDAGFARYTGEMLGQARDLVTQITPAETFYQGLERLAGDSYDVVILDLAIPDGAGLVNVPALLSLAPLSPVIVVGESDDEAVALEAMHLGADDYLVKGQLTASWLERSLRYTLERHRLDRALLEAERKYHGVFDHLVEGIFQTSPEGQYLMANAALARIYGYGSPEELVQNLTDIGLRLYVQPGRREEFVRLMQQFDTLTSFESQIYRKDGSIIWISENCRAVRDARGRLLFYEGTVEDITQRRRAEEKVKRSEALYHSLVETLPQNIFRKDLQLRFTFANRHFCEILGRPLEEIIGKTDFDFFPAEFARKYQNDDRRVLETGIPYDTVEEHQAPGSSKSYVQVVKTPIYESRGEVIGLQGIFWDITAQREAEEQIRRANAELAKSREELRTRNVQMEEDLRMAREIQLTMLPQQYPRFPRAEPDTRSAFEFTHRYLPTSSVGGDFFTVSALSETQVGVFLCDVAGHGVRSALVTAMIRALVEELKPLATDPGQFLTKLNSDLCAILSHTGTPLLTTAFYLVADSKSGAMRYANAGHPKPLHVRRAAAQVIPLANAFGRSQPAMGLLDTVSYQSSEILLSADDLVFLFTDGLVEVQSSTEELYTQAQLTAAVRQHLDLSASDLFDRLLEELRSFSSESTFTDDVCIVGMDFLGHS